MHSMCTGFQAVLGNVPWLVTVVAGPRGVLGLHMIQVHGLRVHSQLAAGGRGCGEWVEDGAEGGGVMECIGVVAEFLDVIA